MRRKRVKRVSSTVEAEAMGGWRMTVHDGECGDRDGAAGDIFI